MGRLSFRLILAGVALMQVIILSAVVHAQGRLGAMGAGGGFRTSVVKDQNVDLQSLMTSWQGSDSFYGSISGNSGKVTEQERESAERASTRRPSAVAIQEFDNNAALQTIRLALQQGLPKHTRNHERDHAAVDKLAVRGSVINMRSLPLADALILAVRQGVNAKTLWRDFVSRRIPMRTFLTHVEGYSVTDVDGKFEVTNIARSSRVELIVIAANRVPEYAAVKPLTSDHQAIELYPVQLRRESFFAYR